MTLAVTGLGALLAAGSVRMERKWIQKDCLRQALQFARTMPLSRIKALLEAPEPVLRSEYQTLKQQLMAARGMFPEWKRIYLLGFQENASGVLLVDSRSPVDFEKVSRAALPDAAMSAALEAFESRRSLVSGPVAGPRGGHAYVHVPLLSPKPGGAMAVLGIEVEAGSWQARTSRSALVPIAGTALLVTLLLATIWVLHGRTEPTPRTKRRWRHQEVLLIYLAGVLLALLAAERVFHYEQRNRREVFFSLSESEFEQLADAFRRIEQTELEGLGRFIEASDYVTPEEFERYVDPLRESPGILTWGWAPAVVSSGREAFERKLDRVHGPHVPGIWKTDEHGHPQSAGIRERYYPVLYLSDPHDAAAYGYAFGTDLSSLPGVLPHLRTLQRSRSAQPSALLRDPPESGTGAHLLVCRPTHERGDEGLLLGFAFAILDPAILLDSTLLHFQPRTLLRLDLLQLEPAAAPIPLASSGGGDLEPDGTLDELQGVFGSGTPFLAFGRSYALIATPSPAFRAISTIYLPWIVLFVGLIVTVSVATVVNVIACRREPLWHLVDQRTEALAASLERQDELAMQSRTVMWEVDANGRYVRLGKVVERLLGYSLEELVGRRFLWDLLPPEEQESSQARTLEAFGQKALISEVVRPIVTKSGDRMWVVTNGIPLVSPEGDLQGYQGSDKDITDRWCAEQSLAASEQQYRMLTENMNDVVWVLDSETLRYRYISPSIRHLLGFSAEEALALPCANEWVVAEERERFNLTLLGYCSDLVQGKIRTDEFFTLQFQFLRADQHAVWTEMSVRFVCDSGSSNVAIHGVTRNIAARKLAEQYHELDIELLRLFEESSPLDALFARCCSLIHERTGMDAVGIRMRSGDDYPYAASSGPLCPDLLGLTVKDFEGKPMRNAQGAPRLKCLCGLVLSGSLSSDTSIFTAAGSVWSNDVWELMSLPCVAGVQNFCAVGGAGSIALVPIRENKVVVGLLQIVDHRRNRFTAQSIQILESIAGHIGEALMRRRAERDYRLLFNGMVEGFALHKILYDDQREPVDCVFLAVNPQFERMTGLSRTAVRDRKASEVLEWSELVWIPTYGKVASTGEPITFRHFMPSRSRHFEITAFEPAPDQVAAIFNDITARVLVEAERERLNQAINQLGEIVLITDFSANILYVNPAFTRVTGYTREEVMGQNPRILKSGVQDADFYHTMWETLSAGRTWMGDLTNRKKDGTFYEAQVSISPVLDAEGQVIHYVAVNVDVTQQKRAEEDRQNLQAQLNQMQKMESIGRLAGGIAHDFNNMLQAIQGYTELAIEQVEPEHPVLVDLLEIRNAAQRSGQLTRQLQAFARKQAIAPKALDVNQVIEGMLGLLQRMIGENVHLEWRPAPVRCPVFMDPGQLDQIVTNLCVNARDAIAEGGHIRLQTSHVTVTREDLALFQEGIDTGEYIRLEVCDDGCGMDESTLRQIFEPFFTTKKKGAGTGLGLPTLYGIAKQNKGGVRVSSAPGKGSTFFVYLPKSDHAETPQGPGARPAEPGRGECLLVVEDEPFILNAAKRMLESLNYRVLAAGSPRAALALFQEHQDEIDLVLSDVIMPEMSGPETIAKMLEIRPELRHLYMSGYTDNLLAAHGVKKQACEVVQKPFSRQVLANSVRAALEA